MKLFSFVLCSSILHVHRLVAAHGGHANGLYVRNNGSTYNSTSSILDKAISALGGRAALNDIKTYQTSAYIYRTQTLAESEVPGVADLATAIRGTQTVTYDLSNDNIAQRIDRNYYLSNWLYFAYPIEDSINASVVVHQGSAGYACYIEGNEDAYVPIDLTRGYLDASLTRVLVREAIRQSPTLLLTVAKHQNSTISTSLPFEGVDFPAIVDNELGLCVLFDSETSLPYVVRVYEDHAIYGKSTSDMVLYNYTLVGNVQAPLRLKIIYNQQFLLVDTLYAPPTINPSLDSGFFNGLPVSSINQTGSKLPPTPAESVSEYGDAEVYEFSQNLLWNGDYPGTLNNLIVSHPLPELSNLYHLAFSDAPVYTTLVADFGSAVMAVDSPPHQSKLVIQWIRETLGKEPTHLLVTHHHHDHNYDAADFVAVGATLVVPDAFRYYWSNIPNVTFATATEEMPFVYKTDEMQVRGVWHNTNVHASDFLYFTWTVGCPTSSDRMAISVADAWSPGFVGYAFDQAEAIQYVDLIRADRVQRDSLVIPIHGVPSNSTELYALTGSSYPDFKTTDFLPGGSWC